MQRRGRLVIPKKLQHRAVAWYHHYLQYPCHTRLEETFKKEMYWTGMRNWSDNLYNSVKLAK
jgi:hypothetical protein